MEFFEVGGCVRDEIMGVRPKDIDFTVVAPSFDAMRSLIVQTGMKIAQEVEEFGTIRAVAKNPFMGHKGGLDFVWARIDGPSSDGRHPDWTRPGTLMDDLARRDFTMNAIAKDAAGNLIDPHGGIQDIRDSILRCVGIADERFAEDSLRILRAMRFAVTKDLSIPPSMWQAMVRNAFRLNSVSKERMREEMEKMFAHDTIAAMKMVTRSSVISEKIFSDGLRLSATMKG